MLPVPHVPSFGIHECCIPPCHDPCRHLPIHQEEVAAGMPYCHIACLFRCFNMGGGKVYAPLLVRMPAMGGMLTARG